MEPTKPLSLSGIDAPQWPAKYDGHSLTEGEAVLVKLDTFAMLNRTVTGDIYLEVPGDIDLENLSGLDLGVFKGIGVRFPAFNDGRGFTTAVRLRRDLGFKGELRALGPVIPDQAQFLVRTGFDSAEVTDARRSAFIAGKDRYQAQYQTDVRGVRGSGHGSRPVVAAQDAPSELKAS